MLVMALVLPLWCFVLGVCLLVWVYTPYELLTIAVYVDVVFGSTPDHAAFLYTLSVCSALMLGLAAKPFLRFYNR